MIKPLCPHCKASVSLFGAEWQSQRNSKEKFCPSCKKTVFVKFDGKAYVTGLALVFFGIAVCYWLLGLFAIYLIPFSFAVPVLPSLRLHAND